jgi:hypothetical protein
MGRFGYNAICAIFKHTVCKILAPIAEYSPINGLAGAKVRCKSPPMSATLRQADFRRTPKISASALSVIHGALVNKDPLNPIQ